MRIFCRSFPSLVSLAQRSSFCTCRACLVVLNYLNFCLSIKLSISLSNLNKSLVGQCILGCSFFPFITLKILCQSLWLVEFLLKNQLITLWEFPCMLLIFVIFPLVAFNVLYLSLIFVSVITMCISVPLWVYPAWDSLCFLDLVDCLYFIQLYFWGFILSSGASLVAQW